jgi:hypothetical protein
VTTSGKSGSAPVRAPGIVNASFWTAIVGLSIIVLNAVLVLSIKDQSIAYSIEHRAPESTATPDQIRQAITLGAWLNFGVSVLFGLLGAYFVRQVQAGERKARVRFTVVAVVLLVCLFFVGNLIALVGLIIVLVAVGLLFTGNATRFLNEQ